MLLLSNTHLSMILLLHLFPLNISIAGGGINHKGHLGHFLAVQDSSIGDLVNQSVTHLLISTSSEHCRAVIDNVSFLSIDQKDEDKTKTKTKKL